PGSRARDEIMSGVRTLHVARHRADSFGRPFLKSAPERVTQMAPFPAPPAVVVSTAKPEVKCHEIEFGRRHPRGSSASLGCRRSVTNTHDAGARHEGQAYRDDRGERQRPIPGSPPWRGERGTDHLLPAQEL